MNRNGKYVISSKSKITNVDEYMIIDCEKTIVVLENFETHLVNMLDGNFTIDDISKRLLDNYKESYNEQEYLEFIDELLRLGIIEET